MLLDSDYHISLSKPYTPAFNFYHILKPSLNMISSKYDELVTDDEVLPSSCPVASNIGEVNPVVPRKRAVGRRWKVIYPRPTVLKIQHDLDPIFQVPLRLQPPDRQVLCQLPNIWLPTPFISE
ncbi:hypothetical protein QCA50_006352 [Cerrena zonata]|uniref:Uncharacterized protein n=1 Tax=Cerrena zonata TaxID=2478898 RepID=A0AAW0G8G3_9APHY